MDFWRLGKRDGREPQESEIGRRLRDGGLHRRRHGRLIAGQLGQELLRTEQEISRVSQIPVGEVTPGGGWIRLLDECRHRADAIER